MANWRDNPEILDRLDTVAELLERGATHAEIAKATGTSESTARRDVIRLRKLWTEASAGAIVEKRAGYTREGRKDVHWREDPEIMVRLEQVAQLMTQNARRWQIAEATGTSYSTAKRDEERVRELWRESASEGVEGMFTRNVAQVQRVQQEAYDGYYKGPKGKRDIRWLRLVLECERELMELFGTKQPEKIALTDPSGEQEYGASAGLTDEERVARVLALVDRARARRGGEAA